MHVGVGSVTPLADLLVLEVHIDGESVEEEDVSKKDTPDKPRDFLHVGRVEDWGQQTNPRN